MNESAKIIVPEIYESSENFVTLDLAEHCTHVETVAQKYPLLTKIIRLSPAPLLLRISAFEHFLVRPMFQEDKVSRWLLDFTNACVYEGEDTKMLEDEVPFEMCLAFAGTICQTVKEGTSHLCSWDEADIAFNAALGNHPEWFDANLWNESTGNRPYWPDVCFFLGRTYDNMAGILSCLQRKSFDGSTRSWPEPPALWTKGWLKKAVIK